MGRDRLARGLDRLFDAFDARLQVGRARRVDEKPDFAFRHDGDDTCAHLFAREFQVLTAVGEALVGGSVGVVRDDRYTGGERLFDRSVERVKVYERDRDAVGFGGDGTVECIDHLADVAVFRARPLVGAAEQFAGVRDAVLRGCEERVRRDVVDEHEFVARVGAEHTGRSTPARGAGAARAQQATHRACSHACEGGASQEGSPAEARSVCGWTVDVEPLQSFVHVIGICHLFLLTWRGLRVGRQRTGARSS